MVWNRSNIYYLWWGRRKKIKIKIQNSNKYRIRFIGRIEPDNGVMTYCEVLGILKNSGINFDFEAIGNGSLHAEFEKFGIVKGFVSDVTSYFQNADIVFASSYLSMLEALVQRKLVVCVYENPLKRDYLLDSPFEKYCIMGADAKDIAEEIIYYQKHVDKLEELQENGYEFAKNQTWEKVTDLYKKLWKV